MLHKWLSCVGSQVHPGPPDPPIEYALCGARPLPLIDGSTCIKHVLLSKAALSMLNRVTQRLRKWLRVLYWSGILCVVGSFFAPEQQLRTALAIIGAPMHLVPTVLGLSVLRFDMAMLLLRSYEFWYASLLTVVASSLAAAMLRDARSFALLSVTGSLVFVLLMDANFRATRAAVVASSLGALLTSSYTFGVVFHLVPDLADVVLLRYNHQSLYADDVMANMLITLHLLSLRNAYRKHFQHTDKKSSSMVVCCSYRCRLALRPIDHANDAVAPTARWQSMPRLAPPTVGATQLELVPIDERFTAFRSVPARWYPRVFVQPCLVVSLLTLVATFSTTSHSVSHTLGMVSVATAMAVIASYASLCHTRLLRRLLLSFDFAFLWLQHTIAHACLADCVGWQSPRALATLSSWLLITWLLAVDAVLPVYRHWLGFSPRLAAITVTIVALVQLFAVYSLLFGDSDNSDSTDPRLVLRDRLLAVWTIRGHERELRVAPLLFARLPTTLSWAGRLLWRLRDRRFQDGELLMLQGRVQYDNRVATRVISRAIVNVQSSRSDK